MKAGPAVSSHGLERHTWGTRWHYLVRLSSCTPTILTPRKLVHFPPTPPLTIEDIFCPQIEIILSSNSSWCHLWGPSFSRSNQRVLDPRSGHPHVLELSLVWKKESSLPENAPWMQMQPYPRKPQQLIVNAASSSCQWPWAFHRNTCPASHF